MSDIKLANSSPEILEEIRKRWSPRAFADKKVEVADLKLLFEAASWAASAFNEQPWRFILANKYQNEEAYNKAFNCLVPGNQAWVKPAPVIGFVVIKENFDKTGEQNKHAGYDSGQAMANLLLQAVKHELYVHQMGGFSADKVREAFNVPEGYTAFTAFCIGYKGDPAQLTADWAIKSEGAVRTRKPVSEIVFENWDKPAL